MSEKEIKMQTKRWILRAGLAAATIVLLLTSADTRMFAQGQGREELREEFHRTYPLAAGGRVTLENIQGAVRIVAWERNEVRVDAVKRAYTAERLAEAEIRIEANADAIRIKTKYPFDSTTWNNDEPRRYNNPAAVDYTLTVPRGAQLDQINLVNGALDIEGVRGDVNANSVNGQVKARGLAGRARLSVVNGRLDAVFDHIDETKTVELSSVNGQLNLTIPSDANAELRVNTVHGAINNDFGLPVRRGEYVGRELAGRLGRGGAFVKLNSVNGQVTIRYARDGRGVSPVTNLLSETPRDDDDDEDVASEINQELNRELGEKIGKEVDKEVRKEMQKAQKDIARETRNAAREAARAERDAARVRVRPRVDVNVEPHIHIEGHEGSDYDGDTHRIEQESKSFPATGVPRVRVETFDGHITVHSWDKPEVMFTASKRAHDEREMQGIKLRAEQRGDEVSLVAEFDKSFSREVKREGNRIVSFSSGATVHYDVYVPRNAAVRASSGDGRLRIEGVNGEVELQTGDGAIDVSNGRGRVRAQTGDGRISITDFEGAADARTGDGRITLDGRFAQLAAQTGDGSISLALPSDTNATIETNAETVSSDGMAAAEDGNESGDGERRVRRWRVGRGGNLFTLRTGDGQIILRQR
jgi:DUF4097 and DUF4098 domain-containing protein YvlB